MMQSRQKDDQLNRKRHKPKFHHISTLSIKTNSSKREVKLTKEIYAACNNGMSIGNF